MWFIVTHSASAVQSQKNFDTHLSIQGLKEKLYITVGTAPQDMSVELYDNQDKLIVANLEDGKALNDYQIGEYYRLHVIDHNNSTTNIFNDASVEKYKISEEAYDARENTFRKWKQQQQQAAGNSAQVTAQNNAKAAEEEEIKMKKLIEERNIKVNSRCEIEDDLQSRGVVKFVGKTQFGSGMWVGIQLDEPAGKNNGSVKGISYFQCEDRFGIFVRPDRVKCGEQYTERLLDELEDDEI